MPHRGPQRPPPTRAGLPLLLLAIVLLGTACLGGPERRNEETGSQARPSTGVAPDNGGAVLYTIGLSTDPYGDSTPAGFGVAVNLGRADEQKLEVRSPGLGSFDGAEWIGERRILVAREPPPFRPALIFRLGRGKLVREGPSPLPPLDTQQEYSPDAKLIASEAVEPCEPNQQPRWKCYRQTSAVYVQAADGSGRRQVAEGHFNTWSPDGRLLVTDESWNAPYEALDVQSGARSHPLSRERVAAEFDLDKLRLGPPRWSADGRYLAAYVGAQWPMRPQVSAAILIAQSDGRPIRLITSPYVVSMFAWSPDGHRLAWTTSGFPDPHELFVLDGPESERRRLFATGARHFDWITWAPDGRSLLLDDENGDLWRLIQVDGTAGQQTFPRLGGRPLWCCPVNAYATLNG